MTFDPMQMPLKLEFELSSAPSDGITRVTFSSASTSPLLLASSWDGSVRLYDVAQNSLQHTFHHQYAVLDCCFADNTRAFSGGLDRKLKMFDFAGQQESLLGRTKCLILLGQQLPS